VGRALATVIIGGLFFEIILTPFIIPILYPLFAPKIRPVSEPDAQDDLPTDDKTSRGLQEIDEMELAETNGSHEN
jgi:hypothetical protein